MTSSPRYTHHRLASFLIVLTLALSFVIPAYAQETTADDETAYVPDDQAVMDASQDGTADLEIAHNTGCAPILTIDQPTNGSTVTGVTFFSGWALDTNETLAGGIDAVDIYRGDTFITSTSTAASRDIGNVRPDVDTAMGRTDARAGWFIRMDWSKEPGGNQTYRVLARSHCEWTEQRVTVNVNPAPPAPAASLSISDESRTLSSNINTGVTQTCVHFNTLGQCDQFGTTGTGVGTICLQRDINGNCISFGTTGTTSTLSDLNFDFTVTLNPASTQTVNVDYATADGSAVQGTDYQQTSGTLTFAPGETSKTVTVRVFNRGNVAFNVNTTRDFFVRLSNPRNASISDGEGRGTIRTSGFSSTNCIQFDVNGNCINFGTGVLGTSGVSINDNPSCTEPASGSLACTFSITSNVNSGSQITGTWSTVAGGTAVAGSACGGTVDYVTASGTWFIPAFSSTASTAPTVSICGGDGVDGPDTFLVQINVTSGNATVIRPTATGTIPVSTT